MTILQDLFKDTGCEALHERKAWVVRALLRGLHQRLSFLERRLDSRRRRLRARQGECCRQAGRKDGQKEERQMHDVGEDELSGPSKNGRAGEPVGRYIYGLLTRAMPWC